MIKHLTAGLALAAFAPAGHGSNWLPSPPNGLFRINYRIYLPTKAARIGRRWQASSPQTGRRVEFR